MKQRRTTDNRGMTRTILASAAFGAFFLGASPEQIYINGAPIPTAFTNTRVTGNGTKSGAEDNACRSGY